jgi:hypothetical protein
MNPKLKRKWIKALRSGDYPQGKGSLKNSLGSYCCLGVLAEIQGCKLDEIPIGDRVTTTLPRGLNAGLTVGKRRILAGMNDGTGTFEQHSFSRIADYIEEKL